MWTGIDLLVWMQDWADSLPQFFTDFFLIVSSPLFYMFIPIIFGIVLYMLVDKKKGEFICLSTIFACNIVNFIKFIVKQPRPWDLDPRIHPPEGSTHADGYSLPSGHAAIGTSAYGSMAVVVKKYWLKALFVIIALLMIFDRLFLCVHTPIDLITGTIVGVAIIVVNWYLLNLSYKNEKNYYCIAAGYILASIIISAITLALMDCDQEIVFLDIGYLMGFTIGRLFEHKFVKYEIPNVSLKNKIIICVVGIIVTFAFIYGLSAFGDVCGMFGSFFAMIWLTAGYPYIVKRKLSKSAS